MLEIYNSMTRKKEVFKSLKEKSVGFYTCGPTVYSTAHVANFSAFIMADLLVRYLKYKDYEVKWVMNITDVGHLTDDNDISDNGEDKMEKAAKKENKTVWDIARFYEDEFHKDIARLNLTKAYKYPRASDHIPEMIEMVADLLAKGYAYETSDGIYYDISKFKNYGKLSGNTIENLRAGSRVDVNEDKKSPYDFALWKKISGTNENHIMQWDSPWGKGFPGWHIECSAMSRKYLGDTLDFHTGGEDNKFPHHESEIAQSEVFTGKIYSNYWMHKTRVVVNNEKMSKSLGNYFTVSDLIEKGYDPMVIRFTFISVHYRSKLNFTLEKLDESKKIIDKFNSFIQNVDLIKAQNFTGEDKKSLSIIKSSKQQFEKALDDDLNVSEALASLHGFMKAINKQINKEALSSLGSVEVINFLQKVDSVFGVFDFEKKKEESISLEDKGKIEKLLILRDQFRAEKNWMEADRVRDELKLLNYSVVDKKKS